MGKNQTSLHPRAQLVNDAGELLFGPKWRGRMADEVGVSRQMMAAIGAGEKTVSDAVLAKVLDVMEAEVDRIQEFSRRLWELRKQAVRLR